MCVVTVLFACLFVTPRSTQAAPEVELQYCPVMPTSGDVAPVICSYTYSFLDFGSGNRYRMVCVDKSKVYDGASVEASTYPISGDKFSIENKPGASTMLAVDSSKMDDIAILVAIGSDFGAKISIDVNGQTYYLHYDSKSQVALTWSTISSSFYEWVDGNGRLHYKVNNSDNAAELMLWDSGLGITGTDQYRKGCLKYAPYDPGENSVLILQDLDGSKRYYLIARPGCYGGKDGTFLLLDAPADQDGFFMWATDDAMKDYYPYSAYELETTDGRYAENYLPTIEGDDGSTIGQVDEKTYVDHVNQTRSTTVLSTEEYSYAFDRPEGYSDYKNFFTTTLHPYYKYPVHIQVNGDFSVENYKITYNTTSRDGAKFTDGDMLFPGQWIEVKLPSANLTGLDYSITSISAKDANGNTISPKIEYRDDKRIAVICVPDSPMNVTINTTYEQVPVDEVKMYAYAIDQYETKITSKPLAVNGTATIRLIAEPYIYRDDGSSNNIQVTEFKELTDAHDIELDWESEDRCEYSYQYKWYITVDGVETPLTDDFVSTNDMFYQLEDYATDKQVRFRCKVIRTRDCTDTSVEYWSEYRDVAVLGLGDPINIQGVEDVNTDVCDITVDNIYIPFRGDVDCYIQKDGGAWEQITKTVNNPDNDTFGPATPTNGVNITFGMHGKYFTYAITSNGTYTVKVCKGQRTTIFPSFTYENFGKEHDTYTFEHMLVPATEITSGSYYEIERCKICGINTSVTQYTIDKVTTIALEENAFVYDEVGVVPEVQVSDEQDVDLTEGTDYEVKLYSDVLRIHEVDRAVNPGAYYLVVTGKGHYRFERVLPFVITHAGPENPGDESEPSGESQPTEPSEHHESNESHETHESHDPHEPHDPHEHTHDTEPTKPSEPSEHTHPTKPSEHTELSKPSEPTKETMEVVTDDPTEPAEPTAMTEGEKQTEPTSEPKTETTVPTTEPEAPASETPTTPGVAIETEKTRGETTVSEPAVETTVTETTASETTIEETTVEPTTESTAEQTSAETLADAPVIEGDGSAQVNNGNGEFDVQNNDKSAPQTSTALRVGLVVAAAAVVSLGCMALLKGQIKKKF